MLLEETDRDLIERCRTSADGDAFRDLFDRYKDKVYTIALRYSGDPVTAQDIAQETFLKLFSAIATFRGDANFDSWLYRLVVNACFDLKRKTRRLAPIAQGFFDLLAAPGASALDGILRGEMSGHVREALDSLAPEQRMIVVLRYSQGLSYDEIGAILGCPSGTVASRLNRAHKAMGRRIARLAGRKGVRGV